MHSKIIERLKSYYQVFETELTAYTQSGIPTTPYASVMENPQKPTWAALIVGITDPEKQKQLAEFERTMTARYCLELLLLASSSDEAVKKEAYLEFTKAQQDPQKINSGDMALPYDAFCSWSTRFNEKLNDVTDGSTIKRLLDYLVVYSDLAKTPVVKAWACQHGISSELGGDEMIKQILNRSDEEVIEILPSFSKLSEKERSKLRLYYPLMTACLGHLYFLEAGPKMLEIIRTALQRIPAHEHQTAINLIIEMAQMLDMMGARGQEEIQGSLTFTHNMYLGSMDMIASIRLLADAASIQPAFESYLQRRARRIGFADYKSIYPTEAQSQLFMRLACKLRLFESGKAQLLKQGLDALTSEEQRLLAEELSFNEMHGIDGFITPPNYEATGFHNITRVSREILRNDEEEIKLALNYGRCFARIVKELQRKHPEACLSTYPISFGKLAFLANEYPHFFDPSTFSANAIIPEALLQKKHQREFGGKSFVELTVPNCYKQPAITSELTTPKQTKTLSPPKDPLATVASRRTPCYGFVVVTYIEQNFPKANTFLMQVRNNIIQIVDPDRKPENCPRKLPELIKTKSLHASLYGSAPFVHQNDYFDFFKSQDVGLNNGVFLDTVRENLAQYLTEQEPVLVPEGLEFKEEDGTILARYSVKTKDNDPRPLVSLKTLLDAGKLSNAPTWDPNPLRDTTVAVVLCVVAIQNRPKDISAIKALLQNANEGFKSLGAASINQCSVIKQFDKRTLTRGKHADIYCDVEKRTAHFAQNTFPS